MSTGSPSLDTPADDDHMDAIRSRDAVRFFADRTAQQGVPLVWDERTASVVGRICRLLDGIPLAIELGAAELSMGDLDTARSAWGHSDSALQQAPGLLRVPGELYCLESL